MSTGRMPGLAAAAVVLAALLSACTGAPATAPSAGPGLTATPATLPAGTLAVGTFTDADGQVLGQVTATAADRDVVFHVEGLIAEQRRWGLAALWAPDAADDPCADGPDLSFGIVGDATAVVFPLEFGHDDPSFVDQLALTEQGDSAASGCVNTIVARAPLAWTFPPLRSYLDTLVDTGPSQGARGTVAIDDGRPVAYTVAGGDTIGEIAERFGISTDDVLYLGPGRVPSPDDPTVYAGETLNLDLRSR